MKRERETFVKKLKTSTDLEDNLQELVDFVQRETKAEGVYVGKLVYPAREIEDDADDTAHQDTEAPKVIKFMHASAGHEFMVDCVLTAEQAPISHKVFDQQDDEA